MTALQYSLVSRPAGQPDLAVVANTMFWLMFRNVASDGMVFEDPNDSHVVSRPGCILASPSWENTATHVSQDYVYNWTRDAAIVVTELVAGPCPTPQPLIDYVTFARACQTSGAPIDRGVYRIDATPRDWSDQSDGPALRTLAILQLFSCLDDASKRTALDVVHDDVQVVLGAYEAPTTNLWEEACGGSFFARAAQRKCLQALRANSIGVSVPSGTDDAIAWLGAALDGHWNGTYYESMQPAPADKGAYDPNIDIVLAALYGSVDVTDTRLLATAARLRAQWADPASECCYAINRADASLGIGPLLGRYPGDSYDGDGGTRVGGHPWAVSTAALAELHYRVAAYVRRTGIVPRDDLTGEFFTQIGVDDHSSPDAVVGALRDAADRMLHAIVFHSDHLELSEQFDADTGYEKSDANLTWSNASFLSAVRARSAIG